MDSLVRINAPDTLEVRPATPQEPGPGEIRIRHQAIGVSFIDIYHRTGLYPLPAPFIPGVEGAGIVEAIGPEVEGLHVGGLHVGDRVAYAGVPGAYASTRLLPAWRAVKLPDEISSETAATSMLRGLTAHMLMTVTYPVCKGSVLLIHAAAGGLGVMLTRWAKQLGADVIGTVSTDDKADFCKANGADHVIVGRDADIIGEISMLTKGAGVDFAVDGIGGSMLRKSLKCVRPFGTVASIGWVAGRVPPIDLEELGTASLSKPSVMAYSADRNRYRTAVPDVLDALHRGIASEIGGSFLLQEADRAHEALRAGHTMGSLLLIP